MPASGPGDDWIARIAADDHPGGFAAAKSFVPKGATLTHPPRILVLHGSLRETSFMGLTLAIHLGLVYGFFLVLPYSKFVHGLYRFAALLADAGEARRSAM